MRYLGLDLGSKTLGISISDRTNTIASVYTTIYFKEDDYDSLFPIIKDIIDKEGITAIILGFPKNMNNTIGKRAEITLEFRDKLKQLLASIEVNIDYPEYHDIEVVTIENIKTAIKSMKKDLEAVIKESKKLL